MHATLSDVIADTTHNSIEAGAKNVTLEIIEDGKFFKVIIDDNGKGMDEETIKRAFNPFYTEAGKHDKRKVGLGLPILKQLCDATDGNVEIKSQKGVGTHLEYYFSAKHIDLPPLGNLVETIVSLFNFPGEFELVFTHRKGSEEYTIARSELAEAVGGLETIDGLLMAREFLASQEEALVSA